jgi:hypothetical protein
VIIQSIGRLAPCCRVILTRAGQLQREGSKRKACFLLAAWLLWIPLTHAQGVGASGIIRGTITDPTGGLIPNVNVTVAGPQTGLQRSVVTDSSGQYQFFALPPATYSVTARISGFATEISKGVVVPIGETVITDFHLSVSTVTAEIVVNGVPPVSDLCSILQCSRNCRSLSQPAAWLYRSRCETRDTAGRETDVLSRNVCSNKVTLAHQQPPRQLGFSHWSSSPSVLNVDLRLLWRATC